MALALRLQRRHARLVGAALPLAAALVLVCVAGISSHAIATARMTELDAVAGARAGPAVVLDAVPTAVLVPLLPPQLSDRPNTT